jgi:hypothetical protein
MDIGGIVFIIVGIVNIVLLYWNFQKRTYDKKVKTIIWCTSIALILFGIFRLFELQNYF